VITPRRPPGKPAGVVQDVSVLWKRVSDGW
jgi:hypothetical protein